MAPVEKRDVLATITVHVGADCDSATSGTAGTDSESHRAGPELTPEGCSISCLVTRCCLWETTAIRQSVKRNGGTGGAGARVANRAGDATPKQSPRDEDLAHDEPPGPAGDDAALMAALELPTSFGVPPRNRTPTAGGATGATLEQLDRQGRRAPAGPSTGLEPPGWPLFWWSWRRHLRWEFEHGESCAGPGSGTSLGSTDWASFVERQKAAYFDYYCAAVANEHPVRTLFAPESRDLCETFPQLGLQGRADPGPLIHRPAGIDGALDRAAFFGVDLRSQRRNARF